MSCMASMKQLVSSLFITGDDSVISDDGESMNSRPTSDGGDTISREKVVNFNDVTAEGAAFVDILCPEGDSVDAQWPHESHVKFISENGGIETYNQFVMDNTSANKNSWTLLEATRASGVFDGGLRPRPSTAAIHATATPIPGDSDTPGPYAPPP